ncbi:MAG: hypothetical protein QXJ74_05515 [Nitrososphaera sp.]|uniref:hypothetical protein n=1 Tax=Nitrososphaera sp. TaxID=1971748 RepID=UPI003171344F
MPSGFLVKAGAIVSTAGVTMLVVFVIVLLAFPVVKECEGDSCNFQSTAPDQLKLIINPGFLASSLLVIAAGIVMIRYSRWRESKAVS